jgi:cyclophilin family peptidyl-prolyl cis-trans isomerase/nitrogen regulatory protein PII-like uncharacterized protein
MKKIILFLSICPFLFAQYTKDDKELVKTTFTKEYNKEIILSYLHSDSPQKIKAVLLSLSQSEDTSWVNEIIGLDFTKYGDDISFTLGQLGECKTSSFFLAKMLSENSDLPSKNIFENLGKVLDQNDIDLLSNIYEYRSAAKIPVDGISLSIANLYIRGIKDDRFKDILLNELTTESASIQRKLDAAYAINRIGGYNKANTAFYSILKNYSEPVFNDDSLTLIQYSLMCFRKTKYFPNDFELLNKLINSNSWLIREETLRASVYYDKWDMPSIKLYLDAIMDSNPNVSRQAAISIKRIEFDSLNKNFLLEELNKLLDDSTKSNTKGELLISYAKLSNQNITGFTEKYKGKVRNEFLYGLIEEDPKNYNYPYGFLENAWKSANLSDKVFIFNAILNLQDMYDSLKFFQKFLLDHIIPENYILAEIISKKLSDNIITFRQDELKEKIENIIKSNLNNQKFTELFVDLYNLSKRIDLSYAQDIAELLEQSQIYSVKKFAYKELGKDINQLRKQEDNFEELWNNAFTYRFATVQTNKGSFVIEFLPQYAPITVGNFCYLVDKGIYNDDIFYRVIPGSTIQSGDGTGTGFGNDGNEIVSEYSPFTFKNYCVGMISNKKDMENSRWFITLSYHYQFDGRHTVFARVVKGFDIVNNIDQQDKIIKIELNH